MSFTDSVMSGMAKGGTAGEEEVDVDVDSAVVDVAGAADTLSLLLISGVMQLSISRDLSIASGLNG